MTPGFRVSGVLIYWQLRCALANRQHFWSWFWRCAITLDSLKPQCEVGFIDRVQGANNIFRNYTYWLELTIIIIFLCSTSPNRYAQGNTAGPSVPKEYITQTLLLYKLAGSRVQSRRSSLPKLPHFTLYLGSSGSCILYRGHLAEFEGLALVL